MWKKLALLATTTVGLVIFAAFPVAALHIQKPEPPEPPVLPAVPEKSGLYREPGHPGILVRVFVHGERPTSTSASALVCNLADPNSLAVVSAAGWHLPSSWTYNLNTSSVPASVGSANLPTIAANGFFDWAVATGNKVSFSRASDTLVTRSAYDGRNIITWGRTRGSTLGVTYIRYYTSSGLVVDVDTIMNNRVPWSWSNSSTCADTSSYDAENILNHEIGHWPGLDDEYDAAYVDNTQFGYGSKGEVKKVTLTTGDSNGAFAIYNP